MTAPDHEPRTVAATVGAGRPTSLAIALVRIATNGNLIVTVSPSNAQIAVTQGDATIATRIGSGTTALPAGDYQVTATAADHEPRTVAATVTAGRTTPLALALEPVVRMRFEGEWVWVVVFSSGIRYEGWLSVSTALDDSDDGSIRNPEGGVWRWCVFGIANCPNPTGIGFFADYEDEWMVAFSEVPTFIKLIGFDDDGAIEVDDEGDPMFIGTGNWYFASGSRATVGVGLARVSTDPTFTSAEASVTGVTDGFWPVAPEAATLSAEGDGELRDQVRRALGEVVDRAIPR